MAPSDTSSKDAAVKEGRVQDLAEATVVTPIVIDLGSLSPKQVNRLKRGEGRGIREAQQAFQMVKASPAPDAPVILLYRKKRKTPKARLPFPFPFPML